MRFAALLSTLITVSYRSALGKGSNDTTLSRTVADAIAETSRKGGTIPTLRFRDALLRDPHVCRALRQSGRKAQAAADMGLDWSPAALCMDYAGYCTAMARAGADHDTTDARVQQAVSGTMGDRRQGVTDTTPSKVAVQAACKGKAVEDLMACNPPLWRPVSLAIALDRYIKGGKDTTDARKALDAIANKTPKALPQAIMALNRVTFCPICGAPHQHMVTGACRKCLSYLQAVDAHVPPTPTVVAPAPLPTVICALCNSLVAPADTVDYSGELVCNACDIELSRAPEHVAAHTLTSLETPSITPELALPGWPLGKGQRTTVKRPNTTRRPFTKGELGAICGMAGGLSWSLVRDILTDLGTSRRAPHKVIISMDSATVPPRRKSVTQGGSIAGFPCSIVAYRESAACKVTFHVQLDAPHNN